MIVKYSALFRGRGLPIVVIVLCMCVLVQMLGVPVTLLTPGDLTESLAGSALEGFSVPSTCPQLAVSSEARLVAERPSSSRAPTFASTPFHPPVR